MKNKYTIKLQLFQNSYKDKILTVIDCYDPELISSGYLFRELPGGYYSQIILGYQNYKMMSLSVLNELPETNILCITDLEYNDNNFKHLKSYIENNPNTKIIMCEYARSELKRLNRDIKLLELLY